MAARPGYTITIANTGQTIAATAGRSLLVTLQMHNVPIRTICGGRAGCGACVVKILSGGSRINPKTPAEQVRLTAINADSTMRLACQSFPLGDIEIEIVNYLGPR